MVDVTIDDLLDGENIRKRGSVGPFNQDGVTFKGSVPPNPPREIHAINQAQLEAELGESLNIPTNQSIKVVIDESFTLSKGFLINPGATLELIASTPNTAPVYTGTEPLLKNSQIGSFSGKSLNTIPEDIAPKGVAMSMDGLTLFMVGNSNDRIYQYNLSIGNDISTAVYSGNFLDVSTEDIIPQGITFSSDGLTLFMVGQDNDRIYQYDLTVANDITTMSFSGTFLNITTEDTFPKDISISFDGLTIFISGDTNERIFQYDLTIANDLSTATFSGNSLLITPQDSRPHGNAISMDGLTLLVGGETNDRIYQYNLTIANDITTASFSGLSMDVSNEDSAPNGIDVSALGTTLFMTGDVTNSIHQYELFTTSDINSVTISNITIIGNSANSIFDVKGTGVVIMRDVNFVGFGDLGTIQVTFSNFRICTFQNMIRGLKFIESSGVGITQCSVVQSIAQNATFFSFVAGVGPLVVDVDTIRVFSAFAGDSLLFLDPNASASSVFAVEKSGSSLGDFYQPGTDIAVNSVALAGNTAEFTTAVSHGLVVGKPVVLSGFGISTYNGTFIVSAVDVDITGTTFQCVGVAFNATDTGNINTQSLDSTDVKVIADANQGIPNSMFTADAGLEIFGAEISSSSLAQDAFEVITSASWAYNNLERFAIGISNQGQVVAQDTELRRYTVNYGATIEKSGGGSVDIGVVLLKNGSIIGFNPPHTVNTGKIQITRGDIVELTKDDTIQVAVINYDASATAIDISQVSLVINRA